MQLISSSYFNIDGENDDSGTCGRRDAPPRHRRQPQEVEAEDDGAGRGRHQQERTHPRLRGARHHRGTRPQPHHVAQAQDVIGQVRENDRFLRIFESVCVQ